MNSLVVKERKTGEVIASGVENEQARVFEGNWYFAPDAVDMKYLRVSERTYTCPYKGVCFWIDLEDDNGDFTRNVAWVYNNPKPGYEFIKDHIGFYARTTSGTVVERLETAVPG